MSAKNKLMRLMIIIFILSLSACGQYGNLYLPAHETPPPTDSASPPPDDLQS